MTTHSDGIPSKYYEEPNSLPSMDSSTYNGLLAIGTLATISLIFTSALLSFITWRMITWKSHYASAVGRNQSVVLIYQLILADFLQSLGFLISFHWVAERQIIGPDGTCFAQGWLIQLGDVASAFFVLSIAIHTTYQVILSRSLSHKIFICCILGTWVFAILLTSLAPIVGGRFVFQRAGVWCWISVDNEGLRLSLHYIWIFIVEFGSILVYATGFYYLFRAKNSDAIMVPSRSVETLRRARTAMLAYAIVYTLLSLPLAAGRMASMSNNQLSDEYYLFAGALFTCSGWVDTILYTITRRALLFDELNVYGRRPDPNMGNGNLRAKDAGFQRQSSTDSILAGNGFGSIGGIKMERTVKIEMDDLESSNGERGMQEYYATAEAYKP
ncbi:G protein-coupled glucose receptor regulating Gpa2-domain-containing protein [Hypoxylon trugodes]|uniref:G protein-coupled glucose receptor regulating Gpa2-domain-containing protein n=1 Tax=Hypoxylon trugodes TaxID=326681 RepID=UPI00218CF9CC|nr:G protein-coupled glucose receptor regulating Gpa2-domain-containing protein [Hypoxylon trugodes]KAI1386805.1 G protein-coupled glucose receptor regulating Gpa2-domain-containing protein [Hypoxylon trugodes]